MFLCGFSRLGAVWLCVTLFFDTIEFSFEMVEGYMKLMGGNSWGLGSRFGFNCLR